MSKEIIEYPLKFKLFKLLKIKQLFIKEFDSEHIFKALRVTFKNLMIKWNKSNIILSDFYHIYLITEYYNDDDMIKIYNNLLKEWKNGIKNIEVFLPLEKFILNYYNETYSEIMIRINYEDDE